MKCYIQLADYGALLNLLPLCLADAESGEKSCIVTTKPYADLLEGVSYVDCKVVDCQPYEMDKAVDWTLDHGLRPGICTQVNGPAELVKRYTYEPVGQKSAVTTSWQKEQWKVAGRLDRWDDCLPLKFDRRNLVRETRLWRDTFPAKNLGKKPIMLLALNGNSSPFPNKDLLAYLLKTTFGDRWRIVEIPKAACLYDLLGFYEKASLLVAVDSAPLHLAWAVRSLPVIAFANDQPIMWAGSSWRPNMVWYCRYGDWLDRWQEMMSVIEAHPGGPNPNMVAIWSAYESKPHCAFSFWDALPVSIGACGRDSAGLLKDSKRVPYLRDCIRMAIQKAKPGQMINLTRPGVRTVDLLGVGPAYSYRMQEGSFAPICDLFTAPREWWKDALQDIPDLLLDSGYWWSETLRAVFLRRGAVDITGVCSRPKPEKSSPPLTEIPPRMRHNRELCEKYMTDNGVTSRYPAVTEQVETIPLDTSKLPPFAYNPSICKVNGKLCLSYRYHFDGDARTRLGIATIVDGAATNPKDLEFTTPAKGNSLEDARLFRFHGETSVSWVESTLEAGRTPRCVVKYGHFDSGHKVGRSFQVKGGSNDGTSMEKNWAFFESDENLFAIYASQPVQVVLQIQGETIINEYKTPEARWPYGVIRGGNIVPYDGKLLRFFHSRTDLGLGRLEPRYYAGACLMDAKPPFKVLAISKKPIIYGSELPRYPIHHFKENVVFPCGATVDGDAFILSLGINDSACLLAKIKPAALNL